ncbi:MAG: hypothetical protein U9N78_09770 [Actinomycetota bacterium]|nr:hypothetical protein [Actinomycetota bacterium]
MEAAKVIARIVLSVVAGVVTFLGTMTAFCDDIGGVPSWERCRSWLGNPIIEWPGGNFSPLFALAFGLGIGYLIWWLLGRSQMVVWVTTGVVALGVVVGLTPFVMSIFTT